ncbi:MAG: hypothetical protein ACRDAU_07960 [Clostridium sp.]
MKELQLNELDIINGGSTLGTIYNIDVGGLKTGIGIAEAGAGALEGDPALLQKAGSNLSSGLMHLGSIF